MKQTLKYIYIIIYEDMRFAENKHSLILTLSSAVIAFATTFLGGSTRQILCSVAAIIFALIAILYSFVALIARNVKVKQKKIKNTGSLIFYKDIIKYDEKTYIDQVRKNYEFTKIYKPDQMD